MKTVHLVDFENLERFGDFAGNSANFADFENENLDPEKSEDPYSENFVGEFVAFAHFPCTCRILRVPQVHFRAPEKRPGHQKHLDLMNEMCSRKKRRAEKRTNWGKAVGRDFRRDFSNRSYWQMPGFVLLGV